MNPERPDARSIEPDDAVTLAVDEIDRLIRFFRILDEWDRNGTGRALFRDDEPAVACVGLAGCSGPQPVPRFEE